jgi:hypothetical protein
VLRAHLARRPAQSVGVAPTVTGGNRGVEL